MVDAVETSGTAAYVLTKIPLITKKVFTYLPAKSINSCARVCKAWRLVSQQIKKCRRRLGWNSYVCHDEENEELLASDIKEILQDVWCEPAFFLGFCSTVLFEEPLKVPSTDVTRYPRRAKCMRVDIGPFLKEMLPDACNFLAVSADGVIGTNAQSTRSHEVESKKSLSYLLIPKLEGLEINTFTIDSHTYTSTVDNHFEPSALSEINDIPGGKDVKAVLFFCNEPLCPPEIGYSLLQHYHDSIVAGGYVDNLICPQNCLNDPTGILDPSLQCITFGGPRLKVASIVIEDYVNSREEVEATMKNLKNCRIPEEQSFAFMFACIGRGSHHYGVSNVEADVFRKFFPKTPLLGFFGNGEVGFTYLPKDGVPPVPSLPDGNRILPKLYHAYTTIICLLSVE